MELYTRNRIMMRIFAKRLKQARIFEGYTQEKFAAMLNRGANSLYFLVGICIIRYPRRAI